MKKCASCQCELSFDEFHRDKNRRDGRSPYCKDCVRNYQRSRGHAERARYSQRERRASNPELVRTKARIDARNRRLRLLGISERDFETIIGRQGSRCWICRRNRQPFPHDLVVDHDHVTGEVRGALCRSCNSAIGLLGDDATLLQRAIEYLNGAWKSTKGCTIEQSTQHQTTGEPRRSEV